MIGSLAWELPYAEGMAIKSKTKRKSQNHFVFKVRWTTSFTQKGNFDSLWKVVLLKVELMKLLALGGFASHSPVIHSLLAGFAYFAAKQSKFKKSAQSPEEGSIR